MRFTELCESFDFSARPGNDHTRNQPVLRFAEIIRSSRSVRAAFDKAPAYRWWWRAILVLHGKPCRDDLSTADRGRILSRGFRFYAMLYILLALIMVAVSVFLVAFKVTEGFYWPGMALFAGIYMGGSSGLAFKGARLYPTDTRDASGLLVVFFVAVIGFLMAFGGALSVLLNQHHPISGIVAVPLLVVFVLFGVGSYILELLYLFYAGCGQDN